MKIQSAIFVALACIVFFSCKKDNQQPAGASGGNPPGPSNSTIQSGFPFASSGHISGVLKTEYFFQVVNNSGYYNAEASFFNNPFPFWMTYAYLGVSDLSDSAGTLSINNKNLLFRTNDLTNHIYSDTSINANYSGAVTWKLNSASAFPGFTSIVPRGIPAITTDTYIPGSFSKSSNVVLQLPAGGYTGADSISVFIESSGGMVYRSFNGNATVLTIPAAAFSNFPVNDPSVAVYVCAKNFSNETINSKTLVYVMQHTIARQVTFTP